MLGIVLVFIGQKKGDVLYWTHFISLLETLGGGDVDVPSNHLGEGVLLCCDLGVCNPLKMKSSLVDGFVLEGALEAIGGLSFKESFIGLFGSGRHFVVLVVEWIKRVKIGGRRWSTCSEVCLDFSFTVMSMTCRWCDEKMRMRRIWACLAMIYFEVSSCFKSKWAFMTRSNNVINAIAEMRISLPWM
ncbi:hypothetical protein Tco_0168793 [Tanacetum coccineum]